MTTTNPTGGDQVWSGTSVDPGNNLTSVSCSSPAMCLAADDRGNAMLGTPAPHRNLSLTVAGTGTGTITGSGITCPSTCSQSYISGSTVGLTATPAPGSTFAGWGGAVVAAERAN